MTAVLLVNCMYTTAFASEDIVRVYVNGEMLPKFGKLLDGNSVIPMRAFLEKIGFAVSWDDTTKTVTAKKDSKNYDGQPLTGEYTITGARSEDIATINKALGDAFGTNFPLGVENM